jgi:hypothetical protein
MQISVTHQVHCDKVIVQFYLPAILFTPANGFNGAHGFTQSMLPQRIDPAHNHNEKQGNFDKQRGIKHNDNGQCAKVE